MLTLAHPDAIIAIEFESYLNLSSLEILVIISIHPFFLSVVNKKGLRFIEFIISNLY